MICRIHLNDDAPPAIGRPLMGLGQRSTLQLDQGDNRKKSARASHYAC